MILQEGKTEAQPRLDVGAKTGTPDLSTSYGLRQGRQGSSCYASRGNPLLFKLYKGLQGASD